MIKCSDMIFENILCFIISSSLMDKTVW